MAKKKTRRTSGSRGTSTGRGRSRGGGGGGGGAGAGGLRLHVLDMGTVMYGDSLVIEAGGKRILIDGGHLGDQAPKDGHPSIPAQLAQVLGGGAPFHFDLLVVTHCHADHIGCLPNLVANKIIGADMALVADPDLGWGKTGTDAGAAPRSANEERVLAALREEDISRVPAGEVDSFLDAAVKLQDSYRTMLKSLASAGGTVIRYTKPADGAPVEAAFKSIGLKVLGPTQQHLKICAQEIRRSGRDSLDALRRLPDAPTPLDAARRALTDVTLDRVGIGAALNDQSIILSLDISGKRILLLGDMQLAVPEVPGLDTEMETLAAKLANAGPFDVIKTPHHTSYNGISSAVLTRHPKTDIWIHSGGSKDSGHPDESALKALKSLNTGGRKIQFARNDHNGLITLDFTGPSIKITTARGKLDDYARNRDDFSPPPAFQPPPPPPPPPARPPSPQLSPVSSKDGVQVTTFVPTGLHAHVDIKVGADGQLAAAGGAAPDGPFRFPSGAHRQRLAFVTDAARLRAAVGALADEVVGSARADGHDVIDLNGKSDPIDCVEHVRASTISPAAAGIVILGGPEVVPPVIVDCLPDGLRPQVEQTTDDPDAFYVWSDEPYADRDGDLVPELPVSRVPDCAKADFFRKVLVADAPVAIGRRHGHRNIARPFADTMFGFAGHNGPMITTLDATPESVGDGAATGELVYFMLHGSDSDGSRFWGETASGAGMLAVRSENIGDLPGATVFTGCCWGAMAWSPAALAASQGRPVRSRTTDTSLALRCLDRGARAYIGCTGAHYSPDAPPYDNAGGPMHRSFWKGIAAGKPPSQALFDAKVEYAAWMRAGNQTPEALAISFKILRQYTYLGLGW